MNSGHDTHASTLVGVSQSELTGTLKDGRPVSLELHEDAETLATATFVCHQVLARVNGDPAGYLKISYIPEDRFRTQIPDTRTFMATFEGKCGIADEDQSLEKTLVQLSITTSLVRGVTMPGEDEIKQMTAAEQEHLLTRTDAQLDRCYADRIRAFKRFHVNAPRVDFIRVYDGDEPRSNDNATTEGEPLSGENYQGTGLAKILYKTGASWMARNGMVLYASGLQQVTAAMAWEKMAEDGLPVRTEPDPMKTDRERLYLDFRGYEPEANPTTELAP